MAGRAVALAMALLLINLQQADACMADAFSTFTLLGKLPTKADEQEVVAQVEVLEVVEWSKPRHPTMLPDRPPNPLRAKNIRVRVVEAMKGVHVGDEFVVDIYDTSCAASSVPDGQSKWRPYIAGSFRKSSDGSLIFRGAWDRSGRYSSSN